MPLKCVGYAVRPMHKCANLLRKIFTLILILVHGEIKFKCKSWLFRLTNLGFFLPTTTPILQTFTWLEYFALSEVGKSACFITDRTVIELPQRHHNSQYSELTEPKPDTTTDRRYCSWAITNETVCKKGVVVGKNPKFVKRNNHDLHLNLISSWTRMRISVNILRIN